MVFGSRSRVKKAKLVDIKLNGDEIQKVPSFKYLGLILDPTLNYNHHISSLIRLILYKMTMLAKLRRYLNNDVAIQIYKSMLLPYFDYADVIFHKACSKDLDKLQRLQNRCLRICLGYDRLFSTDRAHKKASMPFLVDRRHAHALNFMFSRKNRKELLNNREIRTRAHDAPLFNVTIPRCTAFKCSVGYYGSELWNSLPAQTRNINCQILFKNETKKGMLQPIMNIPP